MSIGSLLLDLAFGSLIAATVIGKSFAIPLRPYFAVIAALVLGGWLFR